MATKVTVRGNLDQALRKFKQKVARDGVPSEFKKREAYDKPGVRRRLAKKEGCETTAGFDWEFLEFLCEWFGITPMIDWIFILIITYTYLYKTCYK